MQSWQRTYIFFTCLFIASFFLPKLFLSSNEAIPQVQNEDMATTENVKVFSPSEADHTLNDEDTLAKQKIFTTYSGKTKANTDTVNNIIDGNLTAPAQKKYIRKKSKKQDKISGNEPKSSKELQLEVIGEQQIIEGNKIKMLTEEDEYVFAEVQIEGDTAHLLLEHQGQTYYAYHQEKRGFHLPQRKGIQLLKKRLTFSSRQLILFREENTDSF